MENMNNKIFIIGAGMAGCVLAHRFPDAYLYDKSSDIGGLCKDNFNYQDFVHTLRTDDKQVWKFVNQHTTVKRHKVTVKSYVKGEYRQYPAEEITEDFIQSCVVGYSRKMWPNGIPEEAYKRIKPSKDGYAHPYKYQGVPNFTMLFMELTRRQRRAGKIITNRNVRFDRRMKGKVILTGAIDEFFGYRFGKLPYRGMSSTHYKSEIGLPSDVVTFPDETIPYQRLVDYKRLGYKGGWIGVEIACDEKHYPIRNKESEEMYNKYKALADEKNISLVGRLATFHYLDMDQVIKQALELEV